MSVNFEASIVGPWVLEWPVLVLFLAAGGILTRATIGTRNPELSIGTIGAAQTVGMLVGMSHTGKHYNLLFMYTYTQSRKTSRAWGGFILFGSGL